MINKELTSSFDMRIAISVFSGILFQHEWISELFLSIFCKIIAIEFEICYTYQSGCCVFVLEKLNRFLDFRVVREG